MRTLVNTHHHGDHTFGNHLFGTATVVAHERTRQEVIDFGGPPTHMPFWEPVDWGVFGAGAAVPHLRRRGDSSRRRAALPGATRRAAGGMATIMPGHGPVRGPELIETTLGYLRFALTTARDGRAAGVGPLEAARSTDLGEYGEWHDAERIVGNLHRAYAELDGAERGARIDVAAALGDMVTYNGGRPLTCHA